MKIPNAIERLFEEWEAKDRRQPVAVAWDLNVWKRQFDPHSEEISFLSELPAQLTRDDGESFGNDATTSADSARKAFLYSMAWGFGTTNYGAWRTKQILTANSDAYERLFVCAQTVANEGSVEGYRFLANEGRLKWFGPAFGTKFLYFCSVNEPQARALVLDRLVGDWLARSTDLKINPTRWSTAAYKGFLDQMRNWSHALDLAPDQLEALIFEDERRRKSEQSSD